jgi:hypothetical protein
MSVGYSKTKIFSNDKLQLVREAMAPIAPSNGLVVTCGSYARREASQTSDMDFFTVYENQEDCPQDGQSSPDVAKVVEKLVGNMPATGGAFAKDISKTELLENYGGSKDTNDTITRRMLFLLEGEFLTGESQFSEIRDQIISRYVRETPRDHQLAFYLLNDMIRYWRTMTVDYANKTDQYAENPKPWATRNIKLVFSRKIIYASGLFSVALTADRQEDRKCDILRSLFSMTPIERIQYVCGDAAARRLMQIYDIFLDRISDPEIRNHLDKLDRNLRESDPVFRELKNEGHYFSRELMGLYHKTFHASHPIHMAVIF